MNAVVGLMVLIVVVTLLGTAAWVAVRTFCIELYPELLPAYERERLERFWRRVLTAVGTGSTTPQPPVPRSD
jgi:hypothetical protein